MQGLNIYQDSIQSIPTYDQKALHAHNTVKMIMLARQEWRANFMQRWSFRMETTKLLDLLFETTHIDCTNKRDKIFGLLGVATDVNSKDEAIRPEYGLDVEEVYRKFVIWDIQKNGSLRSLSFASDRTNSKYLLPSWVPDFTQPENVVPLMRYEKRVNYNATKKSALQARISDGGRVLHLRGKAIDSVHLIGSTARFDQVLESVKFEEAGWLQECINITLEAERATPRILHYLRSNRVFHKIFGMTDERYEEFWRTLTCDHNMKALPAPDIQADWIKGFIEYELESRGKDINWTRERFRDYKRIHRTVVAVNYMRRFCATSNGRIGLVPSGTAAGDEICVLYGGRVPYVVRPCEKGYIFIGECYIHGLMHGEAMNMKQLKSRDFALY